MTQGRRSRAGARRSRSSARTPALSDLDLRILDLLASHRVLTQTQLASICPETPARTLRYRCARLAREGLAGRSRPYRERGSAPHHLWPTRRGEALVTGGPPPRGGERREPNPLFLAHAAGLSEFYVALETTLPDDVKLVRFEREAEAREPFATWASREKRAIAPDAFIEIADVDGRGLLAFVELDMGTMSHRRLKQKAAGYAEYAKAAAWRERYRFCPALLFITTTEKRARSFLAAMCGELERDSLLTCACDLASRLPRCATEPRWLLDDEGEKGVDLLAALREARRPYDEELARSDARRREEEAKRERLRSDPEALRSHLRSWSHRDWGIERLGDSAAAALKRTLEVDDPLADAEREALSTLGAMFVDPLDLQLDERELTPNERRAFEALVRHHLDTQLELADELAERYGEGPALRKARRRLEAGEFLDRHELSWGLAEEAKRDGEAAPGRSACARTTSAGERRRLVGSPRPRASPGGCATGRRPSSTRSTAAPCASARAVRRSPTPTRSGRSTNGAPTTTSPGTATSAGPKSWRRSSRPATRGACLDRGGERLSQAAGGRSARRPFRGPGATRRPPRSPHSPQRRAGRSASRRAAGALPRLPRRRWT